MLAHYITCMKSDPRSDSVGKHLIYKFVLYELNSNSDLGKQPL